MFRSLRSTLILPWLLVAVVCCALIFQLRGLSELGTGGEIAKVNGLVKDSGERIKQELSLYLAGFSESAVNFDNADRQHELLLLLDLVLGRYYGIEAFNHQIKRLSKAQRVSKDLSVELARAERLAALGRMSAGLAHEVRNPIGAMRLQAENALARNLIETYQKACGGILQNVRRLDDLLERLLAIVRLDRLSVKLTRVRPWIQDCVAAFHSGVEKAAIDVETPDVEWWFHEQQLSRALHNLVANARQHTPADGLV